MRFNLVSPLLSAYSVVLAFSSAYAAQVINLRGVDFQKTQQQFQIQSSGLKAVGSTSADALKLINQHKDKHNITHFRLQQKYEGFDVLGGYAIVHSKKTLAGLSKDDNSSMNGMLYSGLATDLGKPSANYLSNAEVALKAFSAPYEKDQVGKGIVLPVVYVDTENKAHWAYKVSVSLELNNKIPEKPTAILDAITFKPFIQWNDIKTAVTAVKAQGFGGNPKMGEYTYGVTSYPYLDIRRDNKKALCYMDNESVKVVDMKHRTGLSTLPMQFTCGKKDEMLTGVYWTGYKADGYDRSNGAFSPTNDALYSGYVINHLYKDWYDVNALSNRDGSSMKLVLRVHYGYDYENAFWDGEQMTFGDGEEFFYPLVSLGIAAHEISHGFTEQYSDLQYFGQSGGMNESFSDMAAQAAYFYSQGQNNWLIGAEIIKDSRLEALRYMDFPSRDGDSIDTAENYDSSLDVHHSSGVFNRLFYLIANSAGWNTKKAFDVMVKANMDYWTPNSTFEEGGCGVVNATKDLNYSQADVSLALHQVGIKAESCLL